MTYTNPEPSGNRRRLPNRRAGLTFDLEVGGLHYVATAGFYPDGRLGEIFIRCQKANSTADALASDSAIMCSHALQLGADPAVLRRTLCRDSQGRATGALGAALDFLLQDGVDA